MGATSAALLPEATAQLTSPTPASPRRQDASSEGPAPTQRLQLALAACVNPQARCPRVPLPAPVAAAARSQLLSPVLAFSDAPAAICRPCRSPSPPTLSPAAASAPSHPACSAAPLPTESMRPPPAPAASCVPVASCSCPRPHPACPLPAAPAPYSPPCESAHLLPRPLLRALPLLLHTPPPPLLPLLLLLLPAVLPTLQP